MLLYMDMQRIKLLKNCKQGRSGEVIVVDNNEAFGLIDSGFAKITKEMTSDDYQTSGDKNGKSTIIRSNNKV